ncbi:MAG: preprotein translocase subunit SecA [Acidobacteria bacterium]|nr:preprotein translocase subunit SecA [Acidobacteriota bacterium]
MDTLLKSVFGSKHERDIKAIQPTVDRINALEPPLSNQTDQELRAHTDRFKTRLAAGETLEDLLPETFAVVREAARRVLKMRHFDVQLMGGVVLHQGKIAEMKTGEGKTLVATLPVYLNSLEGKGVHVVTVNDYLARRDAEWMGRVYRFMGLSVGVIQHDMDDDQRRQAYGCDVTYGTNNEFGFDYLRDNMKFEIGDRVQRAHHYSIVDEVDSILIDEARTPLIISGPVESSQQKTYMAMRPLAERIRAQQTKFLGRALREAIQQIDSDGQASEETLEKLLLVKRGDPKNRQYLDLLVKHRDLKKKIDQVEGQLMSNKQLSEFDNQLYCFIDEKSHNVEITEKGQEFLAGGRMEDYVIPDPDDPEYSEKRYVEVTERLHTIQQLVKAYWLYEKDVHYVVNDNKVTIVDEFTGRLMPGRRWSDGLHEAVEAKERVKIERENQTLATVTFQNYFRMYGKLAGMTGTADTEAMEFNKIYKLEVVVVPPNRPMIRMDYPDVVYRTEPEKFRAVVEEIRELHEKGQPVLVGTISIEKSERLSGLLKKAGVKHVVLNAKYHEREAEIVAQAGRKGAVTIATNMAGRGTDIVLGGNAEYLARERLHKQGVDLAALTQEEWERALNEVDQQFQQGREQVIAAGGLHILGTERHESRRIDNQLRGRSGRQGDVGSSRFYLSLEDDLMRIFASEKVSSIMQRLGMEEDVPIESRLISKRIESAQKQVEAHNFSIRKHLLEYDDVMNQQRKTIYGLREQFLSKSDQKEYLLELSEDVIGGFIDSYCDADSDPEEWDGEGLRKAVAQQFGLDLRHENVQVEQLNREELLEGICARAREKYERKDEEIGSQEMRQYERLILLNVLDAHWKDHLLAMDQLKEGIGLRGYGQRDPLVEYKKESFATFEQMMDGIEEQSLRYLYLLQPVEDKDKVREMERRQRKQEMVMGPAEEAPEPRRPVIRGPKIGRNEPCPCGSGKKYKKCCALTPA